MAVCLLAASAALAQDQVSSPGNPPPQQLQNQQQPTPPAQAPTRPTIATTNRVELFNGPTLEEIYCSGFITKKAVRPSGRVITGYGAPYEVAYSTPEYIYLAGDVQVGQEYQLLRRIEDPNKYESYRGQLTTLGRLELYQDLGRAKVLYIRKKIGVAQIETSCTSTLPGDIAVPFVERPRPEFKQTNFEQFPEPTGKAAGRIVQGLDLDTVIGARRIVYLDIGDAKGVKPGDYFRITREYSAVARNEAESLPFSAPARDDTQKDPSKFNFRTQSGELPRRSIGELMVLSTTPDSATALTTLALEDIHLGDEVEMVEAVAIPAPGAAAAQPPQPPTISCSVSRPSIQVGETDNITCNGVAEEGHELTYSYQTSIGQVAPHGNRATLTATTAGPATVTATAVDDRNLSAQTTVNVNVEAITAPLAPTTLNELIFQPNSARVDNRAKALLDDDALRLQRDANATLVLEGSTNPSETDKLAAMRAENAKTYLTKSKGIDANRVQTRPAQTRTGAKVSVILIPAGAPQ